jgi:hypothetical protein
MSEIEDQIRLGLQLVAEDIQLHPERRPMGRPRRRVATLAIGFAVVAAAAAVGIHERNSGSAPQFINDAFDYTAVPYRPGGGFMISPPALPYSVATLSDVSAVSARDGWIVGASRRGGSSHQNGLAWHWDGTAWKNVALPNLSGQVELMSVAAVDDGEAWAVGWHTDRGNYRIGHALVEHWDGQGWSVVPVPYAGSSNLISVSADGPADAWTIGASFRRDRHGKFPASGTRPLLLHWNGAIWSAVALPWARPGLVNYARVIADGPADVWVLVNSQIEHWDGTSWRSVPAPFGPRDPLTAFSATSADDAWAVGSYRKGKHSQTLAAHWDGQLWQIAPTPNRGTDSNLTDVVAVSPDDAWAVGKSEWLKFVGGGVHGRFLGALFEHWDGRSWKVMPGAVPQVWAGFPFLGAAADGTAWAIGSCYIDNALMRWSGSAWTIATHPPDQHRRVGWKARRGHFGHCGVAPG